MKNEKCMNCGSGSLERFLDLGVQPNGNYFPSYYELEKEVKYPFAMAVCKQCWQVQIEEFPPVEMMFVNHPYITGINKPVVDHFKILAKDVIKKFNLSKNSLVIDIGANDGTLLSIFREHGMRTLGVDPGKRTGRLAKDKGITVFETFWNKEFAINFKKFNLSLDLITATAVFYHVDDIHSFVDGLSKVMHDKTIFLAQCVYLKDIIDKIQFDHFYHEHTMIHSLAPLVDLFDRHGLVMIDVEFYPVHGGSFVVYVAKKGSRYPISAKIEDSIANESKSGLNDIQTYYRFRSLVEKNRKDLVDLLKKIKNDGKTVYALGAPLKGSTLLNYCSIGPDLVDIATEVNSFKIGKFTPGTHIPIVFEDSVEKQPDYYLLLSWNFLDFMMEKYSNFLKSGGQFIVPHPEVRVIGEEAIA